MKRQRSGCDKSLWREPSLILTYLAGPGSLSYQTAHVLSGSQPPFLRIPSFFASVDYAQILRKCACCFSFILPVFSQPRFLAKVEVPSVGRPVSFSQLSGIGETWSSSRKSPVTSCYVNEWGVISVSDSQESHSRRAHHLSSA